MNENTERTGRTVTEAIYQLLKLGIICATIGYIFYLYASRQPVHYYGAYYEAQKSDISKGGKK